MLDLSNSRATPPLAPCPMVHLLPPAARYVLRGREPVMAAAGKAMGLQISDIACRSAQQGNQSALWMGPDEQLLLCPVEQGPALLGQLGDALQGLPHSLVDISHRQVALALRGALAETVLSAGCPLDLHPDSFPVGMCTRTLLGKADIVLWRTGGDTFHIEVWRSFAPYASRFLAEAARDIAS